jgi:hypothetical protein
MHAGDIMIIPPNVPHEFRFTQIRSIARLLASHRGGARTQAASSYPLGRSRSWQIPLILSRASMSSSAACTSREISIAKKFVG